MTTTQLVQNLNREFGDDAQIEAWDRAACAKDSETRRRYLAVYHYFKALTEDVLPAFVRVQTEGDLRIMNDLHVLGMAKLLMAGKKS